MSLETLKTQRMEEVMGKGSNGHKENRAARRNRVLYVAQGRRDLNKLRKAKKEDLKQAKLSLKGKGLYPTASTALPPNVYMLIKRIRKQRSS